MPKKIAFSAKPATARAEDWVTGANSSSTSTVSSTSTPPPPTKTIKSAKSTLQQRESAPVITANVTANMKRLTLDIPEDLHRRIKAQCAMRNTKMVDEIRQLLDEKFPVL